MNEDNIHNDEYIEIDLKEYLYILWKNKILIISIIIISIFLSYSYSTLIVDPIYESEATILTPNFELVNNGTFNSSEYINLLKSNEIGNKIKNNFYDSEKYDSVVLDDIYNKIVINSNGDNRNINLTLKDKDPERAKNILTFWINEFIKNVENDIDNVNNNYINNYEERLNEQYNEYTKSLSNKSIINKRK
jgi:capsular polysaccharide biosynthesis protein